MALKNKEDREEYNRLYNGKISPEKRAAHLQKCRERYARFNLILGHASDNDETLTNAAAYILRNREVA